MLISHRTPKETEIRGGHVKNTIPPVWFEDARMPILETIGQHIPPGTVFGVVRHASYDYARELLPLHPVEIRTGFTEIKNSSSVCHQEAWQCGQLAVSTDTILVMIHQTKASTCPIPEPCKQYLVPWTD